MIIGDLNAARTAVSAALKAARSLYEDDADSDTPNVALKLYWPSVQAYRDVIAVQAKIFPDDALHAVKDLPDREVSLLERAMLAAAWLHAKLSDTSPMVARRARSAQ